MLNLFLAMFLALGSLLACAQEQARITNGPVVEFLTPTSGVVAWSTSVSSGSVVKYGITEDHLTQRSEMPWGGYTHRVTLQRLQPDTTYFFQASSPDAQGSGEVLKSEVRQFHTPPVQANAPSSP